MPCGQRVDVREVSPSCAGWSSFDHRDDLLRVHHRQRVPDKSHIAAEQTWKGDWLWRGPYWVADVYINVQAEPGARQRTSEFYSHTLVGVILTDHVGSRGFSGEGQTVVHADRGYIADHGEDPVDFVRQLPGARRCPWWRGGCRTRPGGPRP
jgi:hypothetical protein